MPLPSWVLGRDPPESTKGPQGYSHSKCPKCGTRLAYGYQGSYAIVDNNILLCEKQGCGYVSRGVQPEPPKSPTTVAFGTFNSEDPKPKPDTQKDPFELLA